MRLGGAQRPRFSTFVNNKNYITLRSLYYNSLKLKLNNNVKKTLILLTILFALLSGYLANSKPIGIDTNNTKVALLIGGYYKSLKVDGVSADIDSMAKVLRKSGFDVIIKTDSSVSQVKKAVEAFDETLKDYSIGLIYYSGMGYISSKGYITIAQNDDISQADNFLLVNDLFKKWQLDASKTKILIWDSCLNFIHQKSSFRASMSAETTNNTGGIHQEGVILPNFKNSFMLFGTSIGALASGYRNGGLFTNEFVKNTSIPNRNLNAISRKTIIGVIKQSNDKQTPFFIDNLEQDVYLNTSTR